MHLVWYKLSMVKVMFVCHGNICRSPMAEFLFKKLIEEKGQADKFVIKSSATSYEEIGNPVHYGTAKILDGLNINYYSKRAEKLKSSDYDNYDYFIGMDNANIRNMYNIFNGDKDNKIFLLLKFNGENREVSDPWWTGNFNETFADIDSGVKAFYEYLKEKQ